MKIAAMIARLLLGLVFLVSGLNGLFHFIPNPPPPAGLVGQFMTVFSQSHYFYVVSAVQVIGGALLLVNRYVPLGLTILGPVIFNILTYHVLLDLKDIGPGLVVTVLWVIVTLRHRQNFAGLFAQRTS